MFSSGASREQQSKAGLKLDSAESSMLCLEAWPGHVPWEPLKVLEQEYDLTQPTGSCSWDAFVGGANKKSTSSVGSPMFPGVARSLSLCN